MSNVQTYFSFLDGQAQPIVTKITSSSPTVIVDATGGATNKAGQTNVVELSVIENSGSTPNLLVELYEVATAKSYPLPDTSRKVWFGTATSAVTARQSIEFSSRIVPLGYQLRVTSSDAAGKFDVIGTKVGRVSPGDWSPGSRG